MLERLADRLQHPDADIYVQLDKKSNLADFEHITNVTFVPERVNTGWCEYSTIEATIAGFNHILNSGVAYTHINLLSGQDYPLKPIEEFHQLLFKNRDRTFVHFLSIADDEWLDGKARFAKYHLGDYGFKGRFFLQKLANALLPARKLPNKMKPYGRSQWLTITPGCARYAIDHINNNPRLKRFFRMTWAVDEVFFQTILANSPLRDKLYNDNLRYIESFGANRPTIFTMAHADTLTSSGKFFARKFDTKEDSEIFDYLDKIIGYADQA